MPTREDVLATIEGAEFQALLAGNQNIVSVDTEQKPNSHDYQVAVGVRSLPHEFHLQALGSSYAVPATLNQVSSVTLKLILGGTVDVRLFEEGDIEALSLVYPVGPCPPGYSIGHRDVTGGTFGCLLAHDRAPNHRFILSNNHVMAVSNRAEIGDPILQPGTKDGGTLDSRIARLAAFERLEYTRPNLVDAAVARVERDAPNPVAPDGWETLVRSAIPGLGTPAGSRAAVLGATVVKVGRSSHQTTGSIQQTSHTLIRVNYGPGLGLIAFRNQIRTGLMGINGDSGSVLLEIDDSGAAYVVGLLFAGSPVATYFNPIEDVLQTLAVELGGGTLSIG